MARRARAGIRPGTLRVNPPSPAMLGCVERVEEEHGVGGVVRLCAVPGGRDGSINLLLFLCGESDFTGHRRVEGSHGGDVHIDL